MSNRVATTNILADLIVNASKRGYNRQLDLKKFEAVADPEGFHILSGMLIHEHKHGVACEPHMRCRVLVKVKDSMDPVEAWLDVEMSRFNKLPTNEQIQAAIDKAKAESGVS
jgi:ferredoxin